MVAAVSSDRGFKATAVSNDPGFMVTAASDDRAYMGHVLEATERSLTHRSPSR